MLWRRGEEVMKKIAVVIFLFFFLNVVLSAGVIKRTKGEITFKGFGKFSTTREEKISIDRTFNQSRSDFKGQGIVGGLAAKTVLRSGDFGEIIDLPSRVVYQLDNKKKEFTILPIEKLKERETGAATFEPQEAEGQPQQSDIRVIRSEFKVDSPGEEKLINQFNCRKYLITWLTEWENIRTGVKGRDLLSTEVWTTPLSGGILQAQEEEARFSGEYMKVLGLELPARENEILGQAWLNLLSQLKQGEEAPRLETKNVAKEMKKIEGYPVLISGQFFSSTEEGEEEAKQAGGARGLVGGLAKSVLKKKPKEGEDKEPAMTYYFELVELNLASLSEADFQVPAGYKKKG